MIHRWSLPFFLLLVPGCGARVVGEEASLSPLPQEAYCLASAKAECARLVPCCGAVGFSFDLSACEASKAAACESTRRTLGATGHVYDPAAAAACVAGRRRAAGCVGLRPVYETSAETWATRTACSQVWTGATPLGKSCEAESDCVSAGGLLIACAGPVTAKTCRSVEILGEGQPCDDADGAALRTCATDLLCTPDGSGASRCVRRAARDGACSPFSYPSCVDGLTCDPVTRRCTDPRPLGAPCAQATFRTAGVTDFSCAGSNRCDPLTHVCTAPSPTGGACRPGAHSVSESCAVADRCDPSTLRCVRATPDGAPCTSGDECASTHCSGGRCVVNGGVANAETCSAAH